MKSVILLGDVRRRLSEIPEGSVRTCITSPPYFGLRDYGEADQIGLEETPDAYVAEMVAVFREVWRVLTNDGTLWLNLGDSYASPTKGSGSTGSITLKGKRDENNSLVKNGKSQQKMTVRRFETGLAQKQLIGIPWRVAFALQADGWYLRSDIIWAKPNSIPESVRDRPTKSHEYVFLLSKSPKYYYDHEAIKEPTVTDTTGQSIRFGGTKYGDSDDPKHATKSGNVYEDSGKRNKRDVWTINTKPFKGAHFAVMPEALVEPCVLAGSEEGDTVLDPFTGSGTVAVVANRHGRNFVGTELNPEYAEIAKERIINSAPMFNQVEIV